MPASLTRRRRGGVATGLLALLVTAILLGHGLVPNIGGYPALVESFLPWFGLAIPVLAVVALVRLSPFGLACTALSVIVWCVLFGPGILPHAASGTARITIASENVHADDVRAGRIADDLADRDPDVIAIQEMNATAREEVTAALKSAYPHHTIVGTVGLWSKTPIEHAQRLGLGLGWDRALRADVQTPDGPTRVYDVHLASVRPGRYAERDRMLTNLRTTIGADRSDRIVVAGDFNTSSTDRAFTALEKGVSEAATSGFGLGFTWPAEFPVTRLDHVLVRGMTTVSSRVLPDNGSDHRGILVGLR